MGAFPQEFKPPPLSVKCCYILNTSPSYKDGQHWVAVWQEGGKVYTYDSFGRSPAQILPIFNNNVKGGVIYDDTKNQKINEMNCGQRSLSFLITAGQLGINNAIKI